MIFFELNIQKNTLPNPLSHCIIAQGNNMSKKKNDNKRNNFPFLNEVKKMKDDFKKIIDKMSDEEFLEMALFLMASSDGFDEDWSEDEGWEDEAENFYNNGKNNISNFPTNENVDLPF